MNLERHLTSENISYHITFQFWWLWFFPVNEKNPGEPTVLYLSYSCGKQKNLFSLYLSPTGITCNIIDSQSLLDYIECLGFILISSYHRKVKVKTVPYFFQPSSSWTWRFLSFLQAVLPADETVLLTSNNIQWTQTSSTFEVSPQTLLQLIPPSYFSVHILSSNQTENHINWNPNSFLIVLSIWRAVGVREEYEEMIINQNIKFQRFPLAAL